MNRNDNNCDNNFIKIDQASNSNFYYQETFIGGDIDSSLIVINDFGQNKIYYFNKGLFNRQLYSTKIIKIGNRNYFKCDGPCMIGHMDGELKSIKLNIKRLESGYDIYPSGHINMSYSASIDLKSIDLSKRTYLYKYNILDNDGKIISIATIFLIFNINIDVDFKEGSKNYDLFLDNEIKKIDPQNMNPQNGREL